MKVPQSFNKIVFVVNYSTSKVEARNLALLCEEHAPSVLLNDWEKIAHVKGKSLCFFRHDGSSEVQEVFKTAAEATEAMYDMWLDHLKTCVSFYDTEAEATASLNGFYDKLSSSLKETKI